MRPASQQALIRWAPKGPLDFRALIEDATQHIDEIDNTTETILLGENKDGDWSLEAAGSPWWDGSSANHGPAYNYHPRERGAYAMADASARMMTFKTSHERNLYLWKARKKTDPPTD